MQCNSVAFATSTKPDQSLGDSPSALPPHVLIRQFYMCNSLRDIHTRKRENEMTEEKENSAGTNIT